MPRSFQLTAISDCVQCILLLSGTLSFLPRALRAQGRLRAFWALLAMGMTFWFCYQLMWTYFEVILRTDVPDLCAGDIILFLHIVPFMAALALRPHAPQDEYATRLRQLDFALMMTWWVYLYIFAVTAWQYVVLDIPAYDDNLNFLYLIEKVSFLAGLFVAWLNSTSAWKSFYANLFGATLAYAFSSYLANWAIGRNLYYSGSFYDIPLAASMAWVTVIGLWSKAEVPRPEKRVPTSSHGVWLARVGMIAVFSLPLLGAWAVLEDGIPPRIRSFRLILTLGAALCMGMMVFARQRRLDRELLRLLTQSRDSLAHLKHLQAQITESEKLASIGQLVGGAAHELNNPITAMMGYSDLLLSSSLTGEQQSLAVKIGQHVRRTRLLVSTLLSFAKQGPASMATVDIKTVLRTAAKLAEPLCRTRAVRLCTNFSVELPPLLADSNQLLQMCAQILSSAADAAAQSGIGELAFGAEHTPGFVVIRVCGIGTHPPLNDVPETRGRGTEGSELSSELLGSLGLTACQNIVLQHRGKILCSQHEAGLAISIELPIIPREQTSAETARALWQPQPSA
jgi:signal transduction histidine kinase